MFDRVEVLRSLLLDCFASVEGYSTSGRKFTDWGLIDLGAKQPDTVLTRTRIHFYLCGFPSVSRRTRLRF
ncbi:hypothetical protein ACROYT_G023178 [Oculina patagonica]